MTQRENAENLGSVVLEAARAGMGALGLDPAPLLARAAAAPDRWTALVGLFRDLEAASGDPAIGLHLALALEPQIYHYVLYVALSGATLGDALGQIARYVPLMENYPGASLTMARRGRLVTLALADGGGSEPLPQLSEFALVAVVRFCRWITAHPVTPLEVRFHHPRPADVGEHARLFGREPRFSERDSALVLDARDLRRPSVHADEALHALHKDFAETRLMGLAQDDVRLRTEAHLRAELGRRRCEIGDVARAFGMSERTLQRRLAVLGTSFSEVLDDVRRAQVLKALARGDALDAVAAGAAFSGYSAFYRAVKRWTGKAPSALRDEP
ncbi:MAG: AraC family transcriptional regulator ligand-binding domain-containing protein [Myxococcales bacterium]|nr:AraC family transcriptional regulator ligand-binding domain-containing protein [Myxococcales bacterium]MCB9736426.1 AraC family transcriptional regulator ligand-binding domain-containing protein [Deltaproteobacteria bacterium]